MKFDIPPTIKDVARFANVSTATVSRVLNDSGPVSGETRAKVQQAIEALKYDSQRPRKKTTDIPWFVIMTESIQDLFFSEVIAGIYHRAMDEKIYPLILEMPTNKAEQYKMLKQIKCLPVIGIFAAGFFQSPQDWVDFYDEIRVPIVVMNTLVHHPKITSINVNFEESTYRATQHLLNLNHTRIAYIGVSDYEDFSLSEFRGVERALKDAGFQYPEEFKISVSRTPEGAYQGISQLMMLPPEERPTAIYAFDDELAIYAINSIQHFGLRIPEDISIIGFDNIRMAVHTNPPLTTVHITKRRIGRQAVHLINQLLENEGKELGFTFVDGSLNVRGSTGPAPQANKV